MLKLQFELEYQKINLVNKWETVAADSKNYLVASFSTISDDWTTPITAIFTNDKDEQPYAVVVGADSTLESNECYVPWEVLKDESNVYVSAYCGNLHTTVTAQFHVYKSGYVDGETPSPPSPTVYDAIMQTITNLQTGKQDKLTAGENITIENNEISARDTNNYNDLSNRPQINGVTLSGNKTDDDLGVQSKIDNLHKLSSDLVDDTNKTNKFVSTSDKASWNAKYDKPNGGIPKTDLDSNVQSSLNKADTAIQDISGKADKATTLSGYGITNAYTKAEVDAKLSSVYRYKGTVATYQDLPSTGLTNGDVYNVEADGNNYAWTGTVWDKLGGDIDLSGYQTKIDSSNKLSSDLVDDTDQTNKFVTDTDKTNWNNKLSSANGAVKTSNIDNGAVTTEKLASGAITLEKIGTGVIDSTLSTQGAAAEAKTTGEARNRFDSTVQGTSSTNTSDSIYLKTGETAKITISDFDGTLISVFIKGHSSPNLSIYRDGVYKFTAQYDGLLRLYGAGTTTFIADVELMTLAAVRLENTQARADSNTLEIDALKETVFSSVNGDIEQGSYHTRDGWKYDTAIACRTVSYTPQTALRAVFNDGIKGSVRAFDINGTYVGGYTGSGFSTDATQFVKLDSPIALRDFTAEYGYNLKLVFTESAGGNIVPNDVGLQYEFSVIPDEAEIYTVGTNGDFSGFTEMLIALASNSKEKIVYVDGGVYDIFDEMGGAEYISSIENVSSLNWRDVNHIVPPNTTIIGVGKVVLEWNPSDSEIIGQNYAFLFSPLNLSGSCTIKNIEIRCSNCRYGIHDETSGKAVYNGTTRVLDNVRVYFTASTYGVHYAYGAGHNKNSKYIYNNCVFSAAYGVAWSSHDWTATEYENSTFEFNNCIFKNNLPTSPSEKAGLRFSSSATDSRQDIVKINGCDFNSITFGTEGSISVKQGYTVTTMLCPSFTVIYTDRIASEDRIAPTVYLTLS